MIEELLALNKSPKLYVQTTPAEHSAIINNEVVEVFGFVEPGSEVWVNGNKVAVGNNGIFLFRTQGSKKDLEVRAKSKYGESFIKGHFNVIE